MKNFVFDTKQAEIKNVIKRKVFSFLFFALLVFTSSSALLAQSYPVVHINDQETNDGSGGNTQTVDAPSNISAGDLIIVTLHYRRTNTSIVNNNGLNQLFSETSGVNGSTRSTVAVFYKIATASEPATYTFTTTGNGASQSNWKIVANRITGHNPILPLGPSLGNNTAQFSVSNIMLPSVSTIYDNSLLFSTITTRDNVNAFSYTDSLVFESENRTTALITYDTIPNTGPTGTRTFSWSPQSQSAGVQFVINGIPCVSANLMFTSVSCNGTNDGSLEVVNVAGGSGVYQYNLNGGPWQSSPIFANLTIGNYTVKVRDANNTSCSYVIGTFPLSTTVIANDDSFNAVQNVPLFMNVLTNDQCSYDPSTITITTPPSQGILQIGSNGQLIYLPLGSFSGVVSFVYQICNAGGSACDQATVTIDVEEVLDDPCFESSRDRLFYLPFPENPTQLRQSLLSAGSANNALSSTTGRTVVGISAPYPATIIYYDHWEDGYELDVQNPIQTTSQVWGDGNLANGAAPGYPTDIIPPGAYMVLDNVFPWNRPTSSIFFDGKDKIFSSSNIVISKASGDMGDNGGAGPVFDVQNVKVNVFDVSRFGQSFVIPFGENLNLAGGTIFNYVGLFARAEENGTVVNLDYNGDGTVDISSPVLAEGEVWFYNGQGSSPMQNSDINTAIDIKAGAIVTSNNKIGLDVVFGSFESYGTRNIPIFPSEFYGSSYYCPVYSTDASAPVVGFFVNPNPSPITINWSRSAGSPTSGSFVVPANQGISIFDMNVASATKFQSAGGQSFIAVAVVDADNVSSTYDWALNLIPEDRLTSFTSIAWAPGSSDGANNYNPVWVTPAANTTIYVKYDGNVTTGPNLAPCGGYYDVAYTMTALQSQLIYGLFNDNSGMAIFNCNDVPISAIWGERPFGGTPPATPALDLGYTMDPLCFTQLVFANNDEVITPLNTPITIDVDPNDAAFLTILNPATVSNLGLLEPSNGTIVINANGTITYTPNPGYIGSDEFEYRICAQNPYQSVCDVATVYVTIPCANLPGQNVISGSVYNDVDLDSEVNVGEPGAPNVVVALYEDVNASGTLDGADVLVQTDTTEANGSYLFMLSQDYRYLDQFNTNGSANGSDGTINWTTVWTEINENNGFNAGNVRVTGNRLRIAGNSSSVQVGAQRVVDLAGIPEAVLTYNFDKTTFSSSTADWVDVQIATSPGGPWSTLVRYSGNAASTGTESFDISSWISGSTTIRFIESNNSTFISSELVDFDNVQIQYYLNTNFIVILEDLPESYTPTSPILPFFYPVAFQGVDDAACSNNFGIAQADLEVVKTVDNPSPVTGELVEFTITVSNNGPSNTDGVVVSDLLPTGLTYNSHSVSVGSYNPVNGQWLIDEMDLNAEEVLTVFATVTSSALPSVTNTASILVSNQGDQDSTNNSSFVEVTPTNEIEAVDDTAGPINGLTGGNTGINVLDNDYFNGVILTPSNIILASVTNGPLTVNANGTVTVAPNTLEGTYTILYTICDALIPGNCSTAEVTVEVFNTNEPPLAVDDINTTFENTPVNGNVSTNDTDPNLGDALTFTLLDDSNLDGTLVFNPNGTYSFNPTSGFAGETEFTYTVCDNGFPVLCDTGVVVINVIDVYDPNDNNPPVANDDNLVVYSDDPINVCILCNDNDVDGDVLTVTNIINPEGYNVVLNPNGTVTVTPPVGVEDTTITFEYVICDNGTPSLCDTATVTIDVKPVPGNNPPPTAVDDSYTTPSEQPVSSNVLSNDLTPVGSFTYTVSLVDDVTNGTLVLNPNGTFTYTPDAGFVGNDQFVYELCDNDAPTANCVQATAYILVYSDNQPPLAVDDINTTFENTSVLGDASTNDTDPNLGDVLTFTLLDDSYLDGTLVFNPDGSYSFDPTPNFVGETEFTYVVCDNGTPSLCDTGVVVIEVIDVYNPNDNNPPIANDDNLVVYSDDPINVCILCNDNDVDGDVLTVTNIINPEGYNVVLNPNGTVTVTPPVGVEDTTITFQYVICDNGTPSLCDTATVTIDVKPIPGNNPPPTAVDDSYTTPSEQPVSSNVLGNDLTPVGSLTYTVSLVDDVTNGTLVLNPNGTFTYTPDAGFVGNDQFVYELCDNDAPTANCVQATAYILVYSDNQPPLAVDDINTTFENIPVNGDVSTNDVDPNLGDVLTFTLLVDSNLDGTLVFNPNGTYTFNPTTDFVGVTEFSYFVCDNGTPALCDTAIVVIEVREEPNPITNLPPTANDDNLVVYSDDPISVCILCNDYDLNGDDITVNPTLINPDGFNLVLNPNGTVTVTPPAGIEDTTITFQYVICDDGTPSLCDTATVTIDIKPIPGDTPPPFAVDDAFVTYSGDTLTESVLPNDVLPVSTLVYVVDLVDSTNNGSLVLNPNGTFTYTPNPGFVGNDQFIYNLCDNATPQNCDQATAYIIVKSNDIIALDDDQTALEINSTIGFTDIFNVLPNDSINDTPILAAQVDIEQLDQLSNFAISPTTGQFSVTNMELPGGIYNITYRVCESVNLTNCDTAIVSVKLRDKEVNVQVLLQGALFGTTTGIMRDDLRVANMIPTSNPYSGALYSSNSRYSRPDNPPAEVANAAAFAATGNDAIVDWVFIELRDPNSINTKLHTKAALVQRDGDVVDVDGNKALNFGLLSETSYYVTVKHRNHLGASTALPISFVNRELTFDFTTATPAMLWDTTIVTLGLNYNGYEQVLDIPSGRYALWAGNFDANKKVKYQGSGTDLSVSLQEILTHGGNISNLYSFDLATPVYARSDVNMDAKIKYQGSGNDVAFVLFNVINKYIGINTLQLYGFDFFIEQVPN